MRNRYLSEIYYDEIVNRLSYIHNYIILRFNTPNMYTEYKTNSIYELKMWLNMKFGNMKLYKYFKDEEKYIFEIEQDEFNK